MHAPSLAITRHSCPRMPRRGPGGEAWPGEWWPRGCESRATTRRAMSKGSDSFARTDGNWQKQTRITHRAVGMVVSFRKLVAVGLASIAMPRTCGRRHHLAVDRQSNADAPNEDQTKKRGLHTLHAYTGAHSAGETTYTLDSHPGTA